MSRRTPSHAIDAVREVLTGGTIRAIAGIRDAGEAFLARVKNIDGGDHLDTQGDQDIWVNSVDELTGYPSTMRLFVPGNVLFALPEEGDTAVGIKPRDVDGPGVGYLLFGDAGVANRVPAWVRTKIGIFCRKVLRLESATDDVEVECGSGQSIKLGPAASRGVARDQDTTTDGTILFAFVPNAGPTPASLSITYTPPGGSPQVLPTGSGTITLSGLINSASSKVKAE